MGAKDVQYIYMNKEAFALSARLLYVVGEYASTNGAKRPDFLMLCLKKWKNKDVKIY